METVIYADKSSVEEEITRLKSHIDQFRNLLNDMVKTEEDVKLGRDCINHINGIKCDPRACNLQWVTKEENNRYARLIHENEGIITKPFWYDTKSKWGCKSTGSSNGMAKHSEEEVIQICELLEKGYDCKQCAEIISSKSNDDFNTTYKWIQSIAARRRWKCVSDSYNF